MVEVKEHHQYLVRLDGSGRVSLRTRKHLRAAPGPSMELADHPPSPVTRAGYTPPTPPPAPPSASPPGIGRGARRRRPPPWLRDYVQ